MIKTTLACSIAGISILLAGCGGIGQQPVAATVAAATTAAAGPASPTPDPCSAVNVPSTASPVNLYMKQFDDYAALASSVAQSELSKVIPAMQAIRKAAQEQAIPTCLTDLKHYELLYMDTTIRTLMAFQTSAQPDTLNAGILQARQYHDQYVAELASLLSITMPAPGTSVASQGTAQPTTTPSPAMVINPGPNPLNLHVSPSLTSESVGVLNANQPVKAFGKSSNGEWILVEVPEQAARNAWVYASLVQFSSGDPGVLPIATP